MGEVERKVDMLISGMKTPQKKTRSRVVTIATSILIAIALIAGASLISVYYVQTGTVDVTSLITIKDPLGETHDAGWTETETIGGTGDPVFYEDSKYISGIYKIAYVDRNPEPPDDPLITVYINIVVTEDGTEIDNDGTQGLTVEVVGVGGVIVAGGQITMEPGTYTDFEIHVTTSLNINAASTYGYTITMGWTNGV